MSKRNRQHPWGKPAEAPINYSVHSENQTNSEAPMNPVNPSSKNALKHGCCAASTLLLSTENIEDYRTLETTWLKAYNPGNNEAERHLVQELVNADWHLQRVSTALAQVEAELYKLNPTDWTEAQERKLGRHLRYKTAQSNLVHKARKAIEDYRKSRLNEKTTTEKMSIQKERLEVYKRKNSGEPTWKEHLANMKQQAISLGYLPPGFNPTTK